MVQPESLCAVDLCRAGVPPRPAQALNLPQFVLVTLPLNASDPKDRVVLNSKSGVYLRIQQEQMQIHRCFRGWSKIQLV